MDGQNIGGQKYVFFFTGILQDDFSGRPALIGKHNLRNDLMKTIRPIGRGEQDLNILRGGAIGFRQNSDGQTNQRRLLLIQDQINNTWR